MAKAKGTKPGAPKGVPKPHTKRIDAQFPVRLRAAMKRAGFMWEDTGETQNAALARKANCTHQAIGRYLNVDRPPTTIDATILLDLCDPLSVTPYWLLKNQGTIDDVELKKRPFDEFRRPKPGRIEEKHEADREGAGSARHAPRARRATA